MKITGIRTILFEHRMARPIGDANNPRGRDQYAALAVFLDSDLGLTGVALGDPGSARAIHSMAEDLLVGRDPRGVVGLWQRMADFAFKGGNRGAVTDVIGALDVALWDLKAKANGEPLWKTLGASSRAVKAYASGIDLCLSDDEIRAFYQKPGCPRHPHRQAESRPGPRRRSAANRHYERSAGDIGARANPAD